MAKLAYKLMGATRSDLAVLAPEKLFRVVDVTDPLFDERVLLPFDESMVLNIIECGVLEPILIRFRGLGDDGLPIIPIVDGRQRHAAVLEANLRLVARGEEPRMVECKLVDGDEAQAVGFMIATGVKIDSNVVRNARRAMLFLNMVKSEAKVAIYFGVGVHTINNWKLLLSAAPECIEAVQNGLSAEPIIEMVRKGWSHPVQVKRLNVIIAKGLKGKAAKAVAGANLGADLDEAVREKMMPRKRIEAIQSTLTDMRNMEQYRVHNQAMKDANTIIGFLAGEDRYEKDLPSWFVAAMGRVAKVEKIALDEKAAKKKLAAERKAAKIERKANKANAAIVEESVLDEDDSDDAEDEDDDKEALDSEDVEEDDFDAQIESEIAAKEASVKQAA